VKIWPNWVDLVVIILLFRGCYSGFGRGLLAELFNLSLAIGTTVLALNFWNVVAGWIAPWLWFDRTVGTFLVFVMMLLLGVVISHGLLRRFGDLVKWERLHWTTSGLGMLLGGVRGMWWAGVILLMFVSSGFVYLSESVEQRSVLGPRLVSLAHESFTRVANRFPGAGNRRGDLFPPVRFRPRRPGKPSAL